MACTSGIDNSMKSENVRMQTIEVLSYIKKKLTIQITITK